LETVVTIEFSKGFISLTELKIYPGSVVRHVSGAVDRIMGRALPQLPEQAGQWNL